MGVQMRGAWPKMKIFLKNYKICLEFVKSVMVNRSLRKRASGRGRGGNTLNDKYDYVLILVIAGLYEGFYS